MNAKPLFKLLRIAAVVAAVLVFCGFARAETFSAVMLAERKPGVDDFTWTLFSGIFDDTIRQTESFPPPTSGTVSVSAVRWEWTDADAGEMTATEVHTAMQRVVDNINGEPTFSTMSTWSVNFGDTTGGEGIPGPTILMATNTGADSITLTWSYPQASEFRFKIHRGTNGTYADALKIGEVDGVVTFTDTEAELYTDYFYWVIAVRKSDGEKSNQGLPVIGSAGGKLPIPMVTGLTAKRSDFFSILLNWDTLDPLKYDYALFENGEMIYDKPRPPIAGNGSEEGVIYTYTVAAVRKSDGEIGPQSLPVWGKIVGSGTDGGLRITASDSFGGFDDRISIVWSTPDNLEGEFYELYRAETADFDKAVRIAQLPVLYKSSGDFHWAPSFYDDMEVTEGKIYHYWIQIRDFGGAILLRSDRDEGYLGELNADPDCMDPEAGPQLFSIAQTAYLKASNRGGNDQFGYAVALDGDIAVVGAPGEDSSSRGVNGQQADENAQQSGAVYILSRNPQTGAWAHEAYLKPPVSSSGAKADFGRAVAISGNTVVVGAPEDHNSKGRVYVFVKQGGTWSLQSTLVANDPEAWQGSQTQGGDGLDVSRPRFGYSVAIDGETILVGAPYRDAIPVSALPAYPMPLGYFAPNYRLQRTGAAYVFTRSSGTWSQQKVLIGASTNQTMFYWADLSEDPPTDLDQFNIDRYEEMNALWGCDKRWWEFPDFGNPSEVHFGFSVALSGGVAVIGAPGDDKPEVGVHNGAYIGCPHYSRGGFGFGSATIFEGSGAVWNQTAYLKTPTLELLTAFGTSVAVDGRTVVIGAPYDSSNATAVDGGHNSDAPFSGAAYVFVSGSVGTPWRQQAFLKSTHAAHTTADGKSFKFFGSSISLQGDRLLVAAPSMVRGGCVRSGVAYIFSREGGNWSQQALVRPTASGDEFDLFGGDVARYGATGLAMDGDTLLVGAPSEDGNAIGVGGDESTNGAAESGAAYVLSLSAFYTEIAVSGKSVEITDGDTTTSRTNHTDFGSVAVSSGRVGRTFTIHNLGTADLSLTGMTRVVVGGTNAADFKVTTQPSESVAASGSTTFRVAFNPSAGGLRSATLSIANDDSDENTYDFSIQGTGTAPEINVTGNSTKITDGDISPRRADHTDFGSMDVSSGRVGRTFTIHNLGTADLSLTGMTRVVVRGTNAGDFKVTTQPPESVPPLGATTFRVIFNPSSNGLRTATLVIANDDGDETPYNFKIQGTGRTPSPTVAAASAALASPTSSELHSTTGIAWVDGHKYLSLAVKKTHGGLNFRQRVEVSHNLLDWFSGSNHTSVLQDDDKWLRVRDNTPLTPGTKRFIRLK